MIDKHGDGMVPMPELHFKTSNRQVLLELYQHFIILKMEKYGV